MIRDIPYMRASILLCLGLGAMPFLAGCREREETVGPDSPLASELKLLERQVTALEEAVTDAKKGELFPSGDIAIGLSETAVQSAVSQALPIERRIGSDFQARIERVTVSFRSMQGVVTLEGRVWAIVEPNTYADLVLLGGIGDVDIDRATGVLSARIELDGWDVRRAAAVGAEVEWMKTLVQTLGADGVAQLRELVPDLKIPVGIEKAIDLPGADGHPVAIPAGRVPLDARVSRVLPLSGRLWAMVRVDTTGWEPSPATKGQP